VFSIHFSTFGYFSYFFVKLCNSYLIKCKEEKLKDNKFLGLNGTEPGAKRNKIFLCNGWIKFIKRHTSEKEILFSFRIAVILFILLISGDTIKKSKDVFFRSFWVVYLVTSVSYLFEKIR
jgi:hypothetical protein